MNLNVDGQVDGQFVLFYFCLFPAQLSGLAVNRAPISIDQHNWSNVNNCKNLGKIQDSIGLFDCTPKIDDRLSIV
jgi:hypothetical protein